MMKLNTFIEYLIQNDWKSVLYHNPKVLVFVKIVDGESQVVQLPANEEYSDYAVQMEFALRRLADCEKISVEQARKKVSGEMLISAEDIVDLIEGKIASDPSESQRVLLALLNDIKSMNNRLIEP